MRYLRISLVVVFLQGVRLMACDVCGCAMNFNMDYSLNLVKSHMVGLQYSYTHFESHPEDQRFNTREQFHTYNLMARWQWIDDLRLDLNLPYRINYQQTSRGDLLSEKGLSDARVSALYQVFNAPLLDFASHFFLVSGGIKLPLGEYRFKDKAVRNANFQLGNGSWDVQLDLFYGWLMEDITLIYSSQATLTTSNDQGYTFGNRWLNSLGTTYSVYLDQSDLTFTALVQYQLSAKDKSIGVEIFESGGEQVNGIVGMQWFISQFMVNASYQYPLYQRLSEGFLRQGATLNVSLSYMM